MTIAFFVLFVADKFIIIVWCKYESVMITRFDFSGRDPPAFRRHSKTLAESVISCAHGNASSSNNGNIVEKEGTGVNGTDDKLQCDALFMWWQLEMDPAGKLILSVAPRWGHPTPNNMQVSVSWIWMVVLLHCY